MHAYNLQTYDLLERQQRHIAEVR